MKSLISSGPSAVRRPTSGTYLYRGCSNRCYLGVTLLRTSYSSWLSPCCYGFCLPQLVPAHTLSPVVQLTTLASTPFRWLANQVAKNEVAVLD